MLIGRYSRSHSGTIELDVEVSRASDLHTGNPGHLGDRCLQLLCDGSWSLLQRPRQLQCHGECHLPELNLWRQFNGKPRQLDAIPFLHDLGDTSLQLFLQNAVHAIVLLPLL